MRILLACPLILLLLVGCSPGRESKGLFEEGGPLSEEEKEEVAAGIEALAVAKDLSDPDDEATFNETIHDLTLRGSSIEYLLIEALTEHQDWGVRYGVIHVLDSVGTRSSIEPLIAALADPHHLVAYKALYTLRVMTDHRELVAEGTGDNGLPAVPAADPDDLDSGAGIKPWIRWHREYAQDLRDAWRTWWKAEGGALVIE